MVIRIISILVSISMLTACQVDRALLPSERVVILEDRGNIIGHGFDAGDDTIITATHVVDLCERIQCDIRSKLGSPRYISYYKRESRDDATYLRHPRIILDFIFPEIRTDDSVYALVSRSGSLTRVEGSVTRSDTSYFSYDLSGSGRLLIGAIETDIVFAPGESGSPVWTLSGELVGVVSAVDREKGRSYIVR